MEGREKPDRKNTVSTQSHAEEFVVLNMGGGFDSTLLKGKDREEDMMNNVIYSVHP